MKTLLLIVFACAAVHADDTPHQWTTKDGATFSAWVTSMDMGKVTFSNGVTIPLASLSEEARVEARSEFSRALADNPAAMDAFVAHDLAVNQSKQDIQADRKVRGAGYHQASETEKSINMMRESKYRSQELARAAYSQRMAMADIRAGIAVGFPSTSGGYGGGYGFGRARYVNGYRNQFGLWNNSYYRRPAFR